MKATIRRIVAALLALAMALGLAGCGKNDDGAIVEPAFLAAPNYKQEDQPLPAAAGELEGCCADGSSFWALVTPGEDAAPVLYRVPLDGESAETLPEYQPPEGSEDIRAACLGPVLGGDGTLWVWEQFIARTYELPDGFDPESDSKEDYFNGFHETYQMRQLDPETGKERKRVDVTTAMDQLDRLTFGGMAVDQKGTIYLSDSRQIMALDGQGEILFTIEETLAAVSFSGSAGGSLALLPDGTAAALVAANQKRAVHPIDRDAHSLSEKKYAVPADVNKIYSGKGSCLFYYSKDNVVYGVVEGEELPQRLLPWSNARLENPDSVMCFALLEEGRAAVFTCSYAAGSDPYSGQLRALLLSPTDEAPNDGKTTLLYGMIGSDEYTLYRIGLFNRKSEEYYIEVRDYAEGMLEAAEDYRQAYSSALTRMYAELAAGQIPDLLDGSLALDQLARQGVLEDLWPWIENDPDLGRDAVMEHVLECMEVDGKLPQVGTSFAIKTAVTSASAAGSRTGWTTEEMLAAYGGALPELYFSVINTEISLPEARFARLDRRSMLYNLIDMCLDHYVDWESGECSFEGEDFKALLQLCASVQEPAADELHSGAWYFSREQMDSAQLCTLFPWEGGPVLCETTLSSPYDLVAYDALFGGPESLTDYRQRLWDAGILYEWTSPYNGRDMIYSNIKDAPNGDEADWIKIVEFAIFDDKYGMNQGTPLAADCLTGGADGKVYASYVGFPAESGTGSSFIVDNCVGISAACKAKEGAWAYLRNMLLPGGNRLWTQYEGYAFYDVIGFPLNRAEFESQLERNWCVEDGTGEFYLDGSGEQIEFPFGAMGAGSPDAIVALVYLMSPTQAQLDRFWDLYNAIDHVTGGNEELLELILEQADAYFAGDKSLDETADLIQRRAKLYVNEQK